MKACTKCGETLPLTAFYAQKNRKYSSACKNCICAYAKEYRLPGKVCAGCKTKHPLSHFTRTQNLYKHKPLCNACVLLEHKKRYSAIRGKFPHALDRAKDARLRRIYGISLLEYQNLYVRQKGVCKICNRQQVASHDLAVDHCHKTGRIRGLLCNRCNKGLGMFQDNLSILDQARAYLIENNSSKLL